MALIGGITILIGAVLAFVQDDIKKVLAYSTISQLGYMVMALGVGAWAAAVFHLFTHAFFKALLFLGAGSVSHSGSHHSFDMKKDMGGLRKYMPITFWTFMIGSLALAGHLPARRVLVEGRDPRRPPGRAASTCSWSSASIGAFLTAAYMTRCVYLTFFGEYRGHAPPARVGAGDHRPARSSSRCFAIVAGLVNAGAVRASRSSRSGSSRRSRSPTLVHADFDYPKAIVSVSLAVLAHRHRGVLLVPPRGAAGRSRASPQRNSSRTPGYTFLVNKYYLDDLYENVIVAGIKGPIARGVVLVQPARHRRRRQRRRAAARRTLGRLTYDVVDQKVVDGAVNGIADGHRRGRWRAALGPVRPGAALRAAPVRGGGAAQPRPAASSTSPERRGLDSMDWFDDWALTLAVFIPAVGMAIVLLHPAGRGGARSRSSRCSRRSPRSASASGSSSDFDYDRTGRLQFHVNEPWIDVINSRYHVGIDGISLPLLHPVDVHHRAVRHLLVEPLPRAAQPEGVPRADPAARGRA